MDVARAPALQQSLRITSPDQISSASSDSPRTVASSVLEFSPLQESPISEDLVIPKIEEHDDDTSIKLSPSSEDVTSPMFAGNTAPRKRGRPRKNPITQSTAVSKAPKGRSKTGCLTCRRRKKKCDEAKPHCLCCQKNNVMCEGYPAKEIWKSGKQKAAEARRNSSVAPLDLPPIMPYLKDDVDRHLFDHFCTNVSRMLNLDSEEQNPFRDLLIHMAVDHEGLMHSLLSLAGTHLISSRNAQQHAEITNREQIEDRQEYHFKQANESLSKDEELAKSLGGDKTAVVNDSTCAQVLVLYMQSIAAGDTKSDNHIELQWAQHIMKTHTFPNKKLQAFFYEFVLYHGISNSVTSLDQRSVLMMEDFQLPHYMIQPEAGALLGVVDGLFGFISKTRQIRDRIRRRRSEGQTPPVAYEDHQDGHVIEGYIIDWVCNQEIGSPRYIASMLYRQTAWLYLYRTLLPSVPRWNLQAVVDQGRELLSQLPSDSSTYNILLMPIFLLGCSAFEPYQRPDIVKGFENLQKYSNGSNIYYARSVVEKVWEMMDQGDDRSWDWESIIQERGWDFLIT